MSLRRTDLEDMMRLPILCCGEDSGHFHSTPFLPSCQNHPLSVQVAEEAVCRGRRRVRLPGPLPTCPMP